MKRRIRIVNDTGDPRCTRVLDADTLEVIHGVTSVDIQAEHDMLKARIVVMAELDIVVDAEIVRKRFNGMTGQLESLPEE